MGSLCSPDHCTPTEEPNTMATPRNRGNKNGFHPQSSHESVGTSPNIDAKILDNLEFDRSIDSDQNSMDASATYSNHFEDSTDVVMPNHSTEMIKETSLAITDAINEQSTDRKSKAFQIVVTAPANSYLTQNNGYSPIPNGAQKQTDGTDHNQSPQQQDDLILKQKKKKTDSTLNGVISWSKVADFSALLPRDVKLKLWNGVFKTENDHNLPEQKRISKLLRTFVMLQLTREYKKQGNKVPDELKQALPGAVREPSRFIGQFLKKDEKYIDQTLLTIYDTLCDRFKTNDESKKAKYAKKAKMTQDNYAELTRQDLKMELNEEDYLKTAFMQYMLYAYQMKMDTDSTRNVRNK